MSEYLLEPPTIEGIGGSDIHVETTLEWEVQQPTETTETTTNETVEQEGVTVEVQQPETLVKQGVTGETTETETTVSNKVKQATETGVTTEKETIVLLERDDRYLKQRCRQSYKRMMTQEDPTTPKSNYRVFKNALELRGYKVEPKPIDGNKYYVHIYIHSH